MFRWPETAHNGPCERYSLVVGKQADVLVRSYSEGRLACHEDPERRAKGQIGAGMRASLVLMGMYTLKGVEVFQLLPARGGENAPGRKLDFMVFLE